MNGFLVFIGILLLAGMIAVPVILIAMISGIKGQMDVLSLRIMQLSLDIRKMAKPAEETAAAPTVEAQPEEKVAALYGTVDHQAYMPRETAIEESKPEIQEVSVSGQVEIPATEQPYTQPAKPASKETFNFERFIGENLINKIGIAVLVIGIGLFVKLAIDSDWINELGRVLIGFMSGSVLLALAYYFRRAYRAFSSVLTGGAVVVFYFTVAVAFREYHLFGQTASFLMMVGITAFSVWLSILYNRRELAILSLIGGMLTPFMVSRGDGNYHVLFTYIAILNAGMLALSLRKQWKELLVISFAGTQLIFWLYFLRDTGLFKISAADLARDTALLVYSGVFYTIFLLMPLIQVFRNKEPSKDHALHVIILIANSFFHLLAVVLLLKRMDAGNYQGLPAALLAILNGAVAALLHSNQKDRVLFHLFAGLTISYVTLAAPMQFDGNNITLFWATEAVLLLWLFRKSSVAIYYIGSLLLLALSFIGIATLHNMQPLVFDGHIHAAEGGIFINPYFITRLYASLAFVACGMMLRRRHGEHPERLAATDLPVTLIAAVAAGMMFYTGNRELYMYAETSYVPFWKIAYFMVFASILTMIAGRKAAVCRFRFIAAIALPAIGCLYYWFNANHLHSLLEFFLPHKGLSITLPAILYWIGLAGLCCLFALSVHKFHMRYPLKSNSGKTMMWLFNVSAIITLGIAATEAVSQIAGYSDAIVSNKATVTILWSLCAFAQMWTGMRLKYKTLRIISLSLLALVLCKLFMYDLSAVSQGAKIVAFVVLGVVLLVLSFLYHKLKKILFDEE